MVGIVLPPRNRKGGAGNPPPTGARASALPDRSRIRTGHGPENMTRLRRFAIGLIKGRGLAVAQTMRNLARNPRRVLDFLKMTDNAAPRPAPG